MSVFEDNQSPFTDNPSVYERWQGVSTDGLGDMGSGIDFSEILKGFGSGGSSSGTGAPPSKTGTGGPFPSGWFGDILNGVVGHSDKIYSVYDMYKTSKDEKKFREKMQKRMEESMSSNVQFDTTQANPYLNRNMGLSTPPPPNYNYPPISAFVKPPTTGLSQKTMLLAGAGLLVAVGLGVVLLKGKK
jgi:LPXTG-motif cell wall-anchored protein